VLGLGVPGAWAVLGAIFAAHHGQAIFGPIVLQEALLAGYEFGRGGKNLMKRDRG
jgi:hypothetical protein